MENKRLEAYMLNKSKLGKQNDNNIKDSVMKRYNELSNNMLNKRKAGTKPVSPNNINQNRFKNFNK